MTDKIQTLRETVTAYRNGEFDKSKANNIQKIRNFWYDWFCKDSSLVNKGYSLLQKLNQIADSKKLMRTKHMFGSKTIAPSTATFTTISESAILKAVMLFIALFRNQDMNATRAKHSCTAENMALKPRLSRERGKTLKIGSATKRNNRLPEKAGGLFGEYNATAYYCTLLKNVSRCGRILADAAGVCRFLVSVT